MLISGWPDVRLMRTRCGSLGLRLMVWPGWTSWLGLSPTPWPQTQLCTAKALVDISLTAKYNSFSFINIWCLSLAIFRPICFIFKSFSDLYASSLDIRLSPVIVLVNLESNYLRFFCCQSSTMLVVRNEDATNCFKPPSVIVAVRHKMNSCEAWLSLRTALEATSW